MKRRQFCRSWLAACAAGVAAQLGLRAAEAKPITTLPGEDMEPQPHHQAAAQAPITIGHTHLHVRNLDRSVAFYRDVFAMRERERVANRFAFLSSTDRHHEMALQSIGMGASEPGPQHVGLYHVAFEAPNVTRFATFSKVLEEKGISFAAIDHGISWALYFDDPDGNGLELYVDRRGSDTGTPLWKGQSRRLTAEDIRAAA